MLPISVKEFDQLGFRFNDKYYFDKALPFSRSISCATFDRFATFHEFDVLRRSPVGRLLHYLDDFRFGGRKNTGECQVMMNHFHSCMSDLGVPVVGENTEGPKTVLIFLGFGFDSDEMVVCVPIDKVLEIIQKIEAVLSKRKVTLQTIQSLIGVLQFA